MARTNMRDNNPSPESDSSVPDLSGLADFQFGPAWARPGASQERLTVPHERKAGDRPRNRRPRQDRQGVRDDKGERRFNDKPNGRRNDRNQRSPRFRQDGEQKKFRTPLPEPTEGLRVELRPVDSGLAAIHQKIQKHKRTISLMDMAKLVMEAYDRYDIVFMKQENGPSLIQCKRGDGSCFLTKQEAVKHIWHADWFSELYLTEEEEIEAPKGDFKSVTKCTINNELIGPANWHGYQTALANLHHTRYSHIPFDEFRSKIVTVMDDEAVQQWKDKVSKRVVWKPTRADAEEIRLESATAVEQDFTENHYDDTFATTDKVFINGAVKKGFLSPGLWAHVVHLANVTRNHPSMLIPNLCHGLARHRMPIFKWKGAHYTGPSRPKTMAEDLVLSDSLTSIIDWAKKNPGKGVDAMLKELAPLPESETATKEEKAQADAKQQDLVRDLLWLAEQGYILVFSNNTLSQPKVAQPQPTPKKAEQVNVEEGEKKADEVPAESEKEAADSQTESTPEA